MIIKLRIFNRTKLNFISKLKDLTCHDNNKNTNNCLSIVTNLIEFSKPRFKINHPHKIQPCNTQLYEIINIQIYIHKYTQRETHNNLRLHIFRFFWETWSYYWRLSSQFFIRFYKLTTFPLVPPIDSLVLVKPALSLGIKSKKKRRRRRRTKDDG